MSVAEPPPAARGFRLPAEWEPQESLWLTWPRDPDTWPGRVEQARARYLDIMRAVTPHQRVDLIVHPDLLGDADKQVGGAGIQNVALHAAVHQDSWVRDYGPITVRRDDGLRLGIKFRFNAWGNKYESLLKDEQVVPQLEAAGVISYPVEYVDFVLEGGSIDVDGLGTLLTTRQCLLNENRNPHLDQEGIEQVLRDHLGVKQVLWLGEGIAGDDTDGHVDDITRFVAPGKVVTVVAPEGHPDHGVLQENRELLESMTDARGRALEVFELPAPPAQKTDDGGPLPGSHGNFLITNGGILMPGFGGPSDREAADVLEQAADRDVRIIDCRDLVWGMGAIHCLSMQVPK